jgi:hypothetical protein
LNPVARLEERLQEIERRVSQLERFRSMVIGGALAAAAILGFLWDLGKQAVTQTLGLGR